MGGLAALAAGGLGASCARPVEEAEVLVIGAGIAGLYAAMLLEREGIVPRVIEASDRPGGRLRALDALRTAGPTADGARLPALLGALGLEPRWQAATSPEVTLHMNDQAVVATDWPRAAANRLRGGEREWQPQQLVGAYLGQANPLAAAEDWLRAEFAPLDARSLEAELQRLGASAEALRLAELLTGVNGIANVSALFAYHEALVAAPEGAPILQLDGGWGRLADALAARLSREVQLRRAVARIGVDGRGVECRAPDGRRYRGRFALCSVPFPVLRQMVLDPVPVQAPLIRDLRATKLTEVRLLARRPFWEDDGLPPDMVTDRPFERLVAVRGSAGEVTELRCLMDGQRAAKLDDWSDDRIGRFVMREIEAARPAAAGQLEVREVTAWGQNPFALGAWHFWAPGQWSRHGERLREPWGPVHWIGEHAAVARRGVEGALESAAREVRALIVRMRGGAA
jgi:monoamine oxidase